jgi:hypothetical protein
MTEQELEKLNAGRLLRDAGQVLLPILANKKASIVSRMCSHFRAGELHMLTPLTAELCVITELETNISQNNNVTAMREGKLNGQSTNAQY